MRTKMLKTKKLTKPTEVCIDRDREEEGGALDLFVQLGYRVYEHPIDPDLFAIVSNRVFTYGAFKKYINDDPDTTWWWNEQTDYNSKLNEELPLYFE